MIERLEQITPTKKQKKMTKWDWILLLTIMIIYAGIAFYHLGDFEIPSTEYHTEGTISLQFSEEHPEITEVLYYLGERDSFQCYLEESMEGIRWTKVPLIIEEDAFILTEVEDFEAKSVFSWQKATCHISSPYVRFVCNDADFLLRELVFRDGEGNVLLPHNAKDYEALFDEQKLCPKVSTHMDSTIFDEVYYARTAYEFLHGEEWFEKTHPPLGKLIVAVGIKLFGMNPFGWRSMGTLFGVLMLPVLYFFMKRLCDKTWISAFATALFALDFMHFTQTRLNTIDVYVTFFIMVMYYFMLCFLQTSFYDSSLKKCFVYLLGGGIATGLACATKWTGVYAIGGMALFWCCAMGKRYLEYRFACKNPDECSAGIAHREVIRQFKEKYWEIWLWSALCFIVIPLSIYGCAYLPFSDGTSHGWLQRMIENQSYMYNFHSDVNKSHSFSSWNFEWPVMTTPIWYSCAKISDTVQSNISAFGNPIIWWTGIVVFWYMVYRAVRKKDGVAAFLFLSYLSQFLPWGYVMRITFIYHYFPCVPFVVSMIAYTFYCFSGAEVKKRRRWVQAIAGVYLAGAFVLFGIFYPVISGYPVKTAYVEKYLTWDDHWYFYARDVKHLSNRKEK